MAQFNGYNASIYIASPPSVTFTAEATTDDGTHLNYSITNTAKQYWDKLVAILVESSPDGVTGWATVSSGYIVRNCGGKITFTVSQGTKYFRVSGKYLPISLLGEANEWDLNMDTKLIDRTAFGSAWAQNRPGLSSGNGKFKKWWVDGTFIGNISTDTLLVIILRLDVHPYQYECFAYLKGDAIKCAVAGLTEEELNFEVEGNLYYEIT